MPAFDMEPIWTALSVILWMGSNAAVLLLNKFLLTYWGIFRQPVLLTFLHMFSGMVLTWGLWGTRLLVIQKIQSRQQLLKIISLSFVFAMAVLCANMSLKFLAVSMNQAIGAITPAFAALFAFLLIGECESWQTYSALTLVIGGVLVASGVEPDLHLFGASVCFLGAGFRGLRAVMQAILLKPEEKLDSMSCLAYMAPVSTLFMLVLCAAVEPSSISVLTRLPTAGVPMLGALLANCLAAFASNYFNMVVTQRTSALTIQVLGQFKSVMSAVVSVFIFHNTVPFLGWLGYSVTVAGCLIYGRCKAAKRPKASKSPSISSSKGTVQQHVHSENGVQQYLPRDVADDTTALLRVDSKAAKVDTDHTNNLAGVLSGPVDVGVSGVSGMRVPKLPSLSALTSSLTQSPQLGPLTPLPLSGRDSALDGHMPSVGAGEWDMVPIKKGGRLSMSSASFVIGAGNMSVMSECDAPSMDANSPQAEALFTHVACRPAVVA